MSFAEVRFPTDIAYGSCGGPTYATEIVSLQNGSEKRLLHCSQSRTRYNVAQGIKSTEQLTELITFFRARKGRAEGFRFKDWSDYKLTHQKIGDGDDITTFFPIIKTYKSGTSVEVRRIIKPVPLKITLYVNAIDCTEKVHVDYKKGIIFFNIPPSLGDVIHVEGEFDVPVRFDTDIFCASTEAYNSHLWKDISLIEILNL